MRSCTFCLIFASALIVVGLAAAPAAPRHHSVNLSGGHREPANDCSDLRIRFDDRDAVVRSETRTLSKAETPVLRVHPHANGPATREFPDRKSTRLNSSHRTISYAVFCLKKKKRKHKTHID